MGDSPDKRERQTATHCFQTTRLRNFGYQVVHIFCTANGSCESDMSISVTDLTLESSKGRKSFKHLLRGEADYVIDKNGWVLAWGAASYDLNCKSMDFSNYPYDKHKCEFLIRSDFYPQVKYKFQMHRKNISSKTISNRSFYGCIQRYLLAWRHRRRFHMIYIIQSCQKIIL